MKNWSFENFKFCFLYCCWWRKCCPVKVSRWIVSLCRGKLFTHRSRGLYDVTDQLHLEGFENSLLTGLFREKEKEVSLNHLRSNWQSLDFILERQAFCWMHFFNNFGLLSILDSAFIAFVEQVSTSFNIVVTIILYSFPILTQDHAAGQKEEKKRGLCWPNFLKKNRIIKGYVSAIRDWIKEGIKSSLQITWI